MCTSSAIEMAFYMGTSGVIAYQGSSTVFGTTDIEDGNWHHVALVYDRTAQTATGYVDGNQEFQATAQNLSFSSASKVVYCNGRTTTSFGRWTGLVDEIKLDNTARSPSQFVLPGSGGGGGGDGGGDESCSTSVNTGAEWVFALLLLVLAAVRVVRTRKA
jgi:hypothetical protein